MRRVAAFVLVASACGDPTGIGELSLRDGARYDLRYEAAVHYDCSEHEPTENGFPIPRPPVDPEICGDATDTVLARYDTVTATIRVMGHVDDRPSLFPGADEFEAEAQYRYRTCSVRPTRPCSDHDATVRAALSRFVAPCGPMTLPDEHLQYEVILGPFNLEPACRRTGADSIGVVVVAIASLEGAFFGIGFEVEGGVEGLHSIWTGTVPSRTDPEGRPVITGFNLRELRTDSWELTPS